MYYIMFNATEKAINLLIEAQQQCEELFVEADTNQPPNYTITYKSAETEG
ncbi:MAG: hypothetical protein IKY33_02365 [Clostridia bacterium]|nr:hypothetical protein [Clostridia bacterium]